MSESKMTDDMNDAGEIRQLQVEQARIRFYRFWNILYDAFGPPTPSASFEDLREIAEEEKGG